MPTVPHLLWTRHTCCCCCWSDCALPKVKRPETSRKLNKLVNGKQISIRNVPTGKRDYVFRISVCPGNFPVGRTKNYVYHLRPNRNFPEFVVNDKQTQLQALLPLPAPPPAPRKACSQATEMCMGTGHIGGRYSPLSQDPSFPLASWQVQVRWIDSVNCRLFTKFQTVQNLVHGRSRMETPNLC